MSSLAALPWQLLARGLAIVGLLWLLWPGFLPLLAWLAIAAGLGVLLHNAVAHMEEERQRRIGAAVQRLVAPWRKLVAPWPTSVRVTVAALAVVFPILIFLWVMPAWQAPAPDAGAGITVKDVHQIEDAYRRTWAQIIAAFFVFLGAYVAWRRVAAMERNVNIAEQAQFTERFTRAIDQLGSGKPAVRLGGIYALERIAHDSERDHWTVVETLTAFIRVNRPWPPPGEDETELEMSDAPPTDVQAALTVLGRRKEEWRGKETDRLNLARTDLRGADLPHAHLERAILSEAHLEGANLLGAHLQGANLVGADLEGAGLWEGHLEGANLGGAHLEGALLGEAHLGGAILIRARLEGAYFGGAHLEGVELRLSDGLTYAQLRGATWDEETKLPDHLVREMADLWAQARWMVVIPGGSWRAMTAEARTEE